MSLRDVKRETLYPTLRRFLASNVGKRWNGLYSKICAVESANTEFGREIRRAVEHMVDTKGPSIHPNDYYVDERGLLCASKRQSWKARYRARNNNAPITKIFFENDRPDKWYELSNIDYHWTKDHQLVPRGRKLYWFQFTRVYIDETRPVFEYVRHNDQSKDITVPNQIGVKAYVREEVHKKQCNSKEIKKLQAIALRQVTIKKLEYQRGEQRQLTAYVAGSMKG